jgi:hypothetical protein
MFQINVISEPAAALKPERNFWDIDLASLGRYDLELVKPALLFADSIELTSFRVDMQALVAADAFQNTRMPMRYIRNFGYLSIRRSVDELEALGLTPKDLSSAADAQALISGGPELVTEFAAKYNDQIIAYQRGFAAILRRRRYNLQNDELDQAIQRGVLTCTSWHEEQDPFYLNWKDLLDDFIPEAADILLRRLSNDSKVPLLDPGSQLALSRPLSDTATVLTSTVSRANLPILVASSVLAQLPSLADSTVDEILDLRDSLSEYLPAFRGKIIELADEISQTAPDDNARLAVEIERKWHKDIYPALKEIELEVKSGLYPRNLLRSITTDKTTLASAATSVTLAAGSVYAGAGTFLPAAAAAVYPFVKALNDSAEASSHAKKNRLYFLYRLNKRLRKTRTKKRPKRP